MNERIRYEDIAMHPNAEIRQYKITDEIRRCGDGALITDCLANTARGGLHVLQLLQQRFSDRRYKLRVLSDLWGNPVKEGDVLEWHVSTATRNAFGKKITNAQKKDMVRRGTIRDIEVWHEATVDKYGCIDVSFDDAANLLSTRGVHFESKEPLSRYKRVSSEPKKHPDGSMRLQHFWLYEEVPPWEYAKLTEEPKPKRGRKPKDKSPSNLTAEAGDGAGQE